MSDTNKSTEFFINEINLLRKENEELKKKLSVYEKKKQEEAIKNANTLTVKWQTKNKPKMTLYEKRQMQLQAINRQNIVHRQTFRDNYSV